MSGQLNLTISKEERDMLLDCLGIVVQSSQDPKQSLLNASKLLPLAAKLQTAEEIKQDTATNTRKTNAKRGK